MNTYWKFGVEWARCMSTEACVDGFGDLHGRRVLMRSRLARLVFIGLMVQALLVMVLPATQSLAASDVFTAFRGHWTTIDCPVWFTGELIPCSEGPNQVAILGDGHDESVMTLFIGFGETPTVLFQDSFASSCYANGSRSTRWIAEGKGQYFEIWLFANFIKSGCGTFGNGANTEIQLYYDAGSDTLWQDEDGDGIGLIWYRVGS